MSNYTFLALYPAGSPSGDAPNVANATLTQSPAEGNPPAALSHRLRV